MRGTCRCHHFARAFGRLGDLGFELADQLEAELQTPGRVASLVDTEEDWLYLLQGLTVGLEAAEVVLLAGLLHEWVQGSSRAVPDERRLHMAKVRRLSLPQPELVQAPQIFEEEVGMIVELNAKVRKSRKRAAMRQGGRTAQEVEAEQGSFWACELAVLIEEASLRLSAILAGSRQDRASFMVRACGSRRMKTLRNRVRSWRKVRAWLLVHRDYCFPGF